MTVPQTTNSNLPATGDADYTNPFIESGRRDAGQRFVGDLMKLSKLGEYVAGQDGVKVPLGTELVAVCDEYLEGWVKWEDNKPVDHRMNRAIERHPYPRRIDLGDNDEENWERDDDGRTRDPWQETRYLIMWDPKKNKFYTFSTSSKGGRGACGTLVQAYGYRMRYQPDHYPVIQLSRRTYKSMARSSRPSSRSSSGCREIR
jgi:hypothetical protein